MAEESKLETITNVLQNNPDLEIVEQRRENNFLHSRKDINDQLIEIYIAPSGREITDVTDYEDFFRQVIPDPETVWRQYPVSRMISMPGPIPSFSDGNHGVLCYDETIPPHEVEQLLRERGIDPTNPKLDPGYSLPEEFGRRILISVLPTRELASLMYTVDCRSDMTKRTAEKIALDKLVRKQIGLQEPKETPVLTYEQ